MSLYSSLTQVLAPFAAKINGLLTGWDGTRYSTPGEAVRQQIADLHVLIGDEPGRAISASAISYGDSDVETALDGVNGRLDDLENAAIETDDTLTQSGAAADALAVGNALAGLSFSLTVDEYGNATLTRSGLVATSEVSY